MLPTAGSCSSAPLQGHGPARLSCPEQLLYPGSCWEPVSDALVFCSLPRQAWDLAVDICLSQLPTIIEEGTAFRVSPSGRPVWPDATAALLTWSAHPSGVVPRTLSVVHPPAFSQSLKDAPTRGSELDVRCSAQGHAVYWSIAVVICFPVWHCGSPDLPRGRSGPWATLRHRLCR